MIRADNVSRSFCRGRSKKRSFTAVEGIDLQLAAGNIIALTGRSGSGKSTIINMLSGLLRPSGGQVVYDGRDLYALDDRTLSQVRNKSFGHITQVPSPIAGLTVLENILLPCTLFDKKTDYFDWDNEYHTRAISLMKQLGILELGDAYPSELSGGELKRMMIARALIKSPVFIFADEPTSDLDKHSAELVFDLLRQEADRGAAVLMSTHEQHPEAIADTVISLD
ncbi:ABC transporter ATP-binding protein [Butyrivibrio sp. MC2013]|uniref:ABC transporter ATP-binding protein n=1 Tax=Butyrivibrio sp. MC2013 TaxID=1280686 RepID=UPI0004141B42|nr:ATP-binding cassette domain-containing protein [Butyrivibrio sp. MC2013]